jgi:Mg-chelatase subunit ChlD
MRHISGLACAFILAFFLIGPTPGQAQQSQGPMVSIHSVDDRAFPLVSVAFTLDERGRPVSDIGTGEIRIEESDAPVSELSVQRAIEADIPLALIMTIDVSGSMQGETLVKAQESAKRLLINLKPDDRAAVLSFGEEVRLEQSLSADRGALLDAIDRLRADGSTALYDGVGRSTELAAESRFARRAIVLLSDGKESGDASRLSREASLATAAEAGSPFFVVGVGPEIDREYLEQLATRSGGRYFEAAGAAQVPDIYSSLEELLRSQFVASFLATSPAEPRDRVIRVSFNRAGITGVAERAYTSLRPPPAFGLTDDEGTDQRADASTEQPSSMPAPVAVLLVAAALSPAFAAAGAVLVRRRTRSAGGDHDPDTTNQSEPQMERDDITRLDARRWSAIVVVAGPPGEEGRILALWGEPISLGSADSCGLRLLEDPDVGTEHVRLWVREGRLMLHHLARGHSTRFGGRSIAWAALDDGDQFEVGPYLLRWRSARESGEHASNGVLVGSSGRPT